MGGGTRTAFTTISYFFAHSDVKDVEPAEDDTRKEVSRAGRGAGLHFPRAHRPSPLTGGLTRRRLLLLWGNRLHCAGVEYAQARCRPL